MTAPLLISREQDGALLRLTLNRPKANIVDARMIVALDSALEQALADPELKAVLLAANGPHFSFGASVEEHMPESCAAMLNGLHGLLRRMLESPVSILVAIRGQCLGGGLELALAGHRLFAAPSSSLGQPEMRLGVFAPAASCLLPPRIGQSRAEDMLLSARSLTGEDALQNGLVDQLAKDPEAAAVDYFTVHLAPKSASSLRYAVRAARLGYVESMVKKLQVVENMYLYELMKTRDAVEGLNAFIAKRPAKWENR